MSKLSICIKQPYFFPWIGFWQELYATDKYIVYDDVNYIKRGWINRNRILVNDAPKYFNLPLFGASQNKLINQIVVNNDSTEMHRNCCIIHDAYRKAPYYKEVFPLIENIICNNENNLAIYLEYSIKQICNYLNIETEIMLSSNIKKRNELKAQDKIIDICEVLGADIYVDSMGATELYDKDEFKKHEIELFFLKTNDIQYKQYNENFVGSLSIIDVMMFNPKESIIDMLNKYTLL